MCIPFIQSTYTLCRNSSQQITFHKQELMRYAQVIFSTNPATAMPWIAFGRFNPHLLCLKTNSHLQSARRNMHAEYNLPTSDRVSMSNNPGQACASCFLHANAITFGFMLGIAGLHSHPVMCVQHILYYIIVLVFRIQTRNGPFGRLVLTQSHICLPHFPCATHCSDKTICLQKIGDWEVISTRLSWSNNLLLLRHLGEWSCFFVKWNFMRLFRVWWMTLFMNTLLSLTFSLVPTLDMWP